MLTTKENLKEQIQVKLKEIVTLLYEKSLTDEFSLLSGKSGIALFLFYYSKLSKEEKYNEKACDLITECFDTINKGYNYHTFCTGISGFLWSINHLSNIGFIEKEEIAELQNNLDNFVYKTMLRDIQQGNFDYLHGAIGNAFYLIQRIKEKKVEEKQMLQFLLELEKQSYKETDGGLKWLSVVDIETGEQAYNLSLSHGITSIIAFLSKLLKNALCKEQAVKLLNGSLKYLLKYMQNPKEHGYYFPGWIKLNNIPFGGSRLAWCYNDLGTANVLYWVSEIIKNDDLKQKAIEILLYHSDTRELQNAGAVDAGICHGTAGIAHIYNRMYRNTGIEKFKETAEYWFNETLKMAKFEDGLAGFKAWRAEKFGGWANEYGILEGIAGIGLAFISAVSDIEPKWDECLLLS